MSDPHFIITEVDVNDRVVHPFALVPPGVEEHVVTVLVVEDGLGHDIGWEEISGGG